MLLGKLKIRCGVCQRWADQMTYHYDKSNRGHVFKVECHGDSDTTTLHDRDLADLVDGIIDVTDAFATKRLSPFP